MPIIDKPSFLKRYETLMEHTTDANLARTWTPFLALVNAVFACAAKLVDDPRSWYKTNASTTQLDPSRSWYKRAPAESQAIYVSLFAGLY